MKDPIKQTPFDDQIKELRKAITELLLMRDFDAVKLAREDLYDVVKDMERWLEKHKHDNKDKLE